MDQSVKIYVSSVDDGEVSVAGGAMDVAARRHQRNILEKQHKSLNDTVLVRVSYDETDFCKYIVVDKSYSGDGMIRESTFVADGVITDVSGVVLFLPLADCIGAVLYDKKHHAIMLSHLGRHSLEQQGAIHSVEAICRAYYTQPKNLQAYFSPSVGKGTYPLRQFGGKSLREVAYEQLLCAGVDDIIVDERDTATSKELFSHSQFLKGRQPTSGRHAILCYLESL